MSGPTDTFTSRVSSDGIVVARAMAKGGAGFRDEASANEVNRWLELQSTLGKSAKRHRDVLASVGVQTGSRPRAASARPAAPAAPVPDAVNDENVPSPAAKRAKIARMAAGPYRVPPATVIPPTTANLRAREFMGVDPATGDATRVSYGGFASVKTSAQDAYDAAHDPVNAAVLAPAIANARPEKTRSQTYSAYAESLKGSASDRRHWAARCLRTTKMAADAPVAAAAASVPGIAEDTAKQREVFMRTVVGSRLYYGDVLNPEGIAAVEAKLARATPEEAEETLGAFRDVHAGTAPHRQSSTSTARAHFRQGYIPTEQDLGRRREVAENARRLVTRPESDAAIQKREARKAELRAREAAETTRVKEAAKRAAEEAAKRAAVQGVCCDPAKRVTSKLLEPQIQLGVAYKSAQPEGSTYRISQCGNAAQVEALAKTGAARARKEESITAPFGQINWLNKTEPRRAYPIPKYLVRRSPESVRGRYDDASTSRHAFAPRPREEMKEHAREAAKLRDGNKKKRAESFIPLGPRGIMDHPRHRMTTTTRAEYGDPVAFENAPEVKSHYASGGDGEGGEGRVEGDGV